MARCRNTLEEDRSRFVFGFLCFPLGLVRSISANSGPRISFSGGSLPATLRRSMSCGLNAPSISSSTGFYLLSIRPSFLSEIESSRIVVRMMNSAKVRSPELVYQVSILRCRETSILLLLVGEHSCFHFPRLSSKIVTFISSLLAR